MPKCVLVYRVKQCGLGSESMFVKCTSFSKTLPFFVSALASIAVLLGTFSKDAAAALSMISRANCFGFNESVSWDPLHSYYLWTTSYHYHNGTIVHITDTGWQHTWRSYAGHAIEGWGGWSVSGNHWRWSSSIGIYWMGSTSGNGCSRLTW